MVAEFEVRDTALRRLVGAEPQVRRIAGGFGFTEGPVWTGEALLFSDIPNNRIIRWRALPERPEVTTFRHPVCVPYGTARGGSNGLTLDAQGRLLACEHGGRRLSRTEPDGTVITLVDT